MTDPVQQKLMEAKDRVKLLALDYDGTIYGDEFDHDASRKLAERIVLSDKSLLLVTARGVSAMRDFVPFWQKFFKNNSAPAMFLGGGNGTFLYKIDGNGMSLLYHYAFTQEQVKFIIDSLEKVYVEHGLIEKDFSLDALNLFKDWATQNWSNYIGSEVRLLNFDSKGHYFAESTQLNFVLPREKDKKEIVVQGLTASLGKDFSVKASSTDFCHVTLSLQEDTKSVAVKKVAEELTLGEDQLVAFGDTPLGNDAGLLNFPYSFTNDVNFVKDKKDFTPPPYVLSGHGLSRVGSVHVAIDYLLS